MWYPVRGYECSARVTIHVTRKLCARNKEDAYEQFVDDIDSEFDGYVDVGDVEIEECWDDD